MQQNEWTAVLTEKLFDDLNETVKNITDLSPAMRPGMRLLIQQFIEANGLPDPTSSEVHINLSDDFALDLRIPNEIMNQIHYKHYVIVSATALENICDYTTILATESIHHKQQGYHPDKLSPTSIVMLASDDIMMARSYSACQQALDRLSGRQEPKV